MVSGLEAIHLPLHLASGLAQDTVALASGVGWREGTLSSMWSPGGPGSSPASAPPPSGCWSSLLSAGRWRKHKLREFCKRFLRILLDSAVQQTALNIVVSNNEHLLFLRVLWTCRVADWAWAGLAGLCSQRPHSRPHPGRPGLAHGAAKDFQRQGTASPSPTRKRVSASNTFTAVHY